MAVRARSAAVGAVTAATLVSAGVSAQGEPPRCVGNACLRVELDLPACTIRNLGIAPVSVALMVEGEAPRPALSIEGGETRRLPTCVRPSDLTSFTANLQNAPGGSTAGRDAVVKPDDVLRGFATAGPSCTGNACAVVRVESSGRCAWASNTGKHPVSVGVQFAGQTAKVSLEAPDEKKAADHRARLAKQQADRQAALERRARLPTKEACERDRRWREMTGEGAPGRPTPTTPEMQRFRQACVEVERLAPLPTLDLTAFHDQIYQPVSGGFGGAIYKARLDGANGCALMKDVRAYKADYLGHVPAR